MVISLLNGVQIPEASIKQTVEVAVDKFYASDVIRWMQYDDALSIVAIDLQYEDQHWVVPDGATVRVRMKKPDKHTISNDVLGMDESGIVYFIATRQMTAAWGKGMLSIEVSASGTKNSANVIVLIGENPVKDEDEQSTDEYKSLEKILEEAQAAAKIVSDNAANLQLIADNLEAVQSAGENALKAEKAAEAAQQAAQEALGFRTFFSAITPNANGDLDPSRPMTTPTAASVTVKSKGDRIQSVQVNGFTTQEGTGDPSPTNVRAIGTAGMWMAAKVFDGTENWYASANSVGVYRYILGSAITPASTDPSTFYSSVYKNLSTTNGIDEGVSISTAGTVYVNDAEYGAASNVSGFKSKLAALYAQGTPFTLWYTPADESQATGLYIPIQAQGHEYRCQMMTLTSPLCNGDKVESCVPSGCDKRVVFDGSTDEVWTDAAGAFRITVSDIPSGGYTVPILSNIYTPANTNSAATSVWPDKSIQGGVSGGTIYVKDTSFNSNLSAFRAALTANPLIVWYQSTDYVESNDIQVQLETHANALVTVDGANTLFTQGTDGYTVALPGAANGTVTCNCFSNLTVASNTVTIPASQFPSSVTSLEQANTWVQSNPVTILFPLATPAVYAHDPVTLVAVPYTQADVDAANQLANTPSTLPAIDSPDVPMLLDNTVVSEPDVVVQPDGTLDAENTQKAADWIMDTAEQVMALVANAVPVVGTYVVSSQDGTTLSVSLKAMQDGGDAATLGGMTLEEIKKLISDMIAAAASGS